MLPLFFLLVAASCVVLWAHGASVMIVAPLGLLAWTLFALVLLPKLRTYKAAMGLDTALRAIEGRGWRWFLLGLKGLKVLIFGFLTSMVPFLGTTAQWLNGQNLSFFFDPSNPRTQQTVMFGIGAVIFVVPFVTSWLHANALADAAQQEPVRPAADNPPREV